MFNEFTSANILIAFIGILGLLLAFAFDRYLVRRHGSLTNAAYLARMYASRTTFDFHRIYRSVSITPGELILPVFEPKMLTASPARLLLTAGRP